MTLTDVIKTIRDWSKTKFQPKGTYLESGDLDEYSLISETGASITLTMDPNTFEVKASLKDKNGTEISTSNVDLPLETMIVNIAYNDTAKTIAITLKNGQTLPPIAVSDIVSGLVPTTRTIAGIDLADDITAAELITALGINDKVDKETGKGLSTNDFTNDYKAILDDIDGITETNLNELLNGTTASA